MRNYDTVDATPLFLIVTHEFARLGGDVEPLMPNIRGALGWIKGCGDSNGDGFIDYHFAPERSCGGLAVQSWMDSVESVFYEDPDEHPEVRPPYPIAPVEVQAYVWSAYMRWGEHFAAEEVRKAESRDLLERATILKKKFNETFVLWHDEHFMGLAYALDGSGTPLASARSSMAHVLWASYGGSCILDAAQVGPLVKRLMAADLFESRAGIRTLSRNSRAYDPVSYHNGSIWP